MKIKGEVFVFSALTALTMLFVVGLLAFNQKPTQVSADKINSLVREDSQVLGVADAKATLVEFGDFQCPACATVEPTLQELRTLYKDKVKFVFRHFPLPSHDNALPAARATEAASAQGKFWGYHDLLYQHQTEWSALSDPTAKFEAYAVGLGLDLEKFQNSYQSGDFDEKIQADKKDGLGLNVAGTPTFYLNGKKLVGNYSLNFFKTEVERALEN
ncbi:MAG: thioredoxin domain-containing protein [bacterium]|nr:thioredoxin domain-containing protein [bacterium]